MAKNRDKTEAKARKHALRDPDRLTKSVRVIQVYNSVETKGFLYLVREGGRNGKILYTSVEARVREDDAYDDAVVEHEGRSKFDYILERADGSLETL